MGVGPCLHKRFWNLLPKPCRSCRWPRCTDKSSLFWKTAQFDKFSCQVKTRATKSTAISVIMVITITFSAVTARRYLMYQLVLEILTNWLQQDSWSRITRSFCTGAVASAWMKIRNEAGTWPFQLVVSTFRKINRTPKARSASPFET